MKLLCDGENENSNKFDSAKIILKFLGIFVMIGLSVIFFHNMLLRNSKFLNKLQYDISDSNLENEFKILYEELKSKNKKVSQNEKEFVKEGEIFIKELIREIKDDEDQEKMQNLESRNEIKIDNKKNLKRDSDVKMLIENINEEIIDNHFMKEYLESHESDLDFYDI